MSEAAKLYIEFKTEQRLGKPPAGPKDLNGDSLSALPTLLAGNGASPNDRARDRDRVLKRSSGSSRPLGRPSTTAEAIESFVKK